MHYKLAFVGFGNVARALIRLLERKRGSLKDQYDVTYSITVSEREGMKGGPEETACGLFADFVNAVRD